MRNKVILLLFVSIIFFTITAVSSIPVTTFAESGDTGSTDTGGGGGGDAGGVVDTGNTPVAPASSPDCGFWCSLGEALGGIFGGQSQPNDSFGFGGGGFIGGAELPLELQTHEFLQGPGSQYEPLQTTQDPPPNAPGADFQGEYVWRGSDGNFYVTVSSTGGSGTNDNNGDTGNSGCPGCITAPPNNLPNLTITSFSVPNGTPGQTVNASVTIVNNGALSTTFSHDNFRVEINDNASSMTCSSPSDAGATPSALAAGASITLSIPLTLPVAVGSYIATALADSDCQITESNENDNARNNNYVVALIPPPYVPDDGTSSFSPGSFSPGGNSAGGNGAGGSCSASQGQVCSTASNACGMYNLGRIQCNGACSVTDAPSNNSCPTPNVSINGTMLSPCVITWNATNVTSCTLVGAGVNTSGKSGTIQTPKLPTQASYTLTCYNGPTIYTSKLYSCLPNPSFEEF